MYKTRLTYHTLRSVHAQHVYHKHQNTHTFCERAWILCDYSSCARSESPRAHLISQSILQVHTTTRAHTPSHQHIARTKPISSNTPSTQHPTPPHACHLLPHPHPPILPPPPPPHPLTATPHIPHVEALQAGEVLNGHTQARHPRLADLVETAAPCSGQTGPARLSRPGPACTSPPVRPLIRLLT